MSVSLDEAIERLSDARVQLGNPQAFYRQHEEGWTELARAIVRQVLGSQPPPGSDEPRWAQTVEGIAQSVTAFTFDTGDECGVTLFAAMGTEGQQRGRARKGRHPDVAEPLNYDLVLAWVEAGRRGDLLGKHLDHRDAHKSNKQIAWRVWHALRLKHGANMVRLRAAIAEWAAASGISGSGGEWLGAVLEAWNAAFEVRAAEDFRAWVAEIVKPVR